MGGLAVIEQGAQQVDIAFDAPYVGTPVVNTSLSLDASTTDAELQSIMGSSVKFAVVNRTSNGFSILLSEPAPENMTFSWIALAIKDMKIWDSASTTQPASPTGGPTFAISTSGNTVNAMTMTGSVTSSTTSTSTDQNWIDPNTTVSTTTATTTTTTTATTTDSSLTSTTTDTTVTTSVDSTATTTTP
jgi:hypothetical protein